MAAPGIITNWHWAKATETGGEKIVLLLRALSAKSPSNQVVHDAASIHQTAHLHAHWMRSRCKGLNYWPAWIFGVINPT